MIEESRNIEERCKMIVQVVRLPYPTMNPTPAMKDVTAWYASLNKEKPATVVKGSKNKLIVTAVDDESGSANEDGSDDDEN